MDFLDKLTNLAKEAVDKTNEIIEVQKLNSKISDENNKIAKAKEYIGDYYFEKFTNGEVLDEKVLLLCEEIVQAQERIEKLRLESEAVKAEKTYEQKTKDEESTGLMTCPYCDSIIPKGKKFCPECGSSLKD